MNRILRVAVPLLGILETFVGTFLACVKLQMAYFGSGAYENDAGANFGTVASSLLPGVIVSTVVGILLFDWVKRDRRFKQPSS